MISLYSRIPYAVACESTFYFRRLVHVCSRVGVSILRESRQDSRPTPHFMSWVCCKWLVSNMLSVTKKSGIYRPPYDSRRPSPSPRQRKLISNIRDECLFKTPPSDQERIFSHSHRRPPCGASVVAKAFTVRGCRRAHCSQSCLHALCSLCRNIYTIFCNNDQSMFTVNY